MVYIPDPSWLWLTLQADSIPLQSPRIIEIEAERVEIRVPDLYQFDAEPQIRKKKIQIGWDYWKL